MKKVVLVVLAVFSTAFSLFAQKQVTGFMGIPFGTPKEEVLKKLKEKGGVVMKEEEDMLFFNDIKFGGRETSVVAAKFYNGQLCAATAIVKSEENKVIDTYQAIVEEFNIAYFKGETVKYFKSPYHEGDGYETQAIRLGKATYGTIWETKTVEKEKNSIEVIISEDYNINITYRDGAALKLAIANEKASNAKDY